MFDTICVLLHLLAILSPGTYSTSEINYQKQINQPHFDAIVQDSNALSAVVATHGADAELVWVWDYSEE